MKIKQVVKLLAINSFVMLALIVIIEGISSITLSFSRITRVPITNERKHTKYDEELGWVNIPNLHIEDMYGPGIYLKTNSQAFRNEKDFSINIPDRKLRLLCSGDSFTLGYGVANNRTWCYLLTTLIADLETVNLGQGGYGIDQIYLLYKRNGLKLEHNIHIFAFITWDFSRMKSADFAGYGKPVMTLVGDKLVVDNIPIPKRSYYNPRFTQSIRFLSRELKAVEFSRAVMKRLLPKRKNSETSERKTNQQVQKVFAKILDDLQTMSQERDSTLILVYLPVEKDYFGSKSTYLWQQYVKVEAKKRGILLIDLVEDLKQLSHQEIKSFFIQGDGHYSNKGNAYVADRLSKALLTLPELRERIGPKSQ